MMDQENVGTLIKQRMVRPVLLMMCEEQKNSCFRVKNKKIILESTKGIKPNEETYADYGPDYWPRSHYKKFFFF